jgi:hypothetical protein
VIGEDQKGRVIPYAQLMGAGYFAVPTDVDEHSGAAVLAANAIWINEAMNQECRIYDIGSDGRETPSPFYVGERAQITARMYPFYYPVPFIAP